MSAARHPAVRWLYLLGGCAMVALAVIGALLPVMPTTIFLILALACFSKSSPRLEQKLLDHPRYGPGLRRWREQRIVPVKAKCFAALGMGGGFVALLLSRPPHWVPWLVAAIELAVLLYLLSRPSRPDDPAGWRLGPRGWRCLALLLCVALHLAALTAGLWWPGRQKAATAPAETPAMQWLAGGGDPVPAERRISARLPLAGRAPGAGDPRRRAAASGGESGSAFAQGGARPAAQPGRRAETGVAAERQRARQPRPR
ncbi:YbaN family protein [Chromobacterium phragmitis]|uniref:YbaN family protein n=1 Tax=Chromobacterium phragmitis TaxID=2202141 RepID=A0ABV0IUK4_9NEIS